MLGTQGGRKEERERERERERGVEEGKKEEGEDADEIVKKHPTSEQGNIHHTKWLVFFMIAGLLQHLSPKRNKKKTKQTGKGHAHDGEYLLQLLLVVRIFGLVAGLGPKQRLRGHHFRHDAANRPHV